MNMQKISQWFSLLLFMTMVAGCSSLGEDVATQFLITPTAFVISPSPTETILPTITSPAADTPIPVSTLTAAPISPEEDARERLLNLLATNGDCRLPCLWGITPGKSDYQEARNILLPLSSIANPENTYFETTPLRGVLGGTIVPTYAEGDSRLKTHVAYVYDNDGVVNYIIFQAVEQQLSKDQYGNQLTTPIFDSPTFMKRIQYYSLSHVLSEQGIPESVMIEGAGLSFSSYMVIPGTLDIALLYPEQGIWVNYTMAVDYPNGVIRGCPTNAHVHMVLYPSGDSDSFFTLLDQTDWGIKKAGYKPLEDATSMSVEEFYEIFRNPTDACIETPENLWPTPEGGG